MPVVTVLRGFKIHYLVLDAFLQANGMDEILGYPPIDLGYDRIAALLRTKMGQGAGDARLVVPHRETYDQSVFAYVAYTWLHVFSQREIIEGELPEAVPERFQSLRKEMLGLGPDAKDADASGMGLYIVLTENRNWRPRERQGPQPIQEGPVVCDHCEQTFATARDRKLHLRRDHGSLEGMDPLPEAI